VIEAQDGEEAISKAESIQPDIILMDTSLPGVDGLTAMLRIRTLETMRSVPIIFLSGHAQQKAREVAIATGATEYLIKPVLLDELESAVRTHLKRDLQWKKDAEISEETV
jgi:DNA-binding response OmpR family regulator